MKNKQLYLLGLFAALSVTTARGQATQSGTTTGNLRPATGQPFLGWNNSGTSGTLEIRNDFNQPINFFPRSRKTSVGCLVSINNGSLQLPG
jgi:hypothetical protein